MISSPCTATSRASWIASCSATPRISQADFSVLLVLSEAPDRKLRTGELAELLAWEKSRVSHQVSRMESRGLLERTECDTDARGTWVGLTDEGRRILLGSMREHAAAIRSLFFDNLDQGEKAAIAGVSTPHHRAHQPGRLRPRRREGHDRATGPSPDVGRVSGMSRTNAGRPGTERADVVIVGGGHNGLAAAAYLASAGKSVVVLERLDGFGGAAVSAPAFPGVDARLSRYSYLVSLLPQMVIRDLKLDIRLARRRYSSYTPLPGTDTGLLVDTGDEAATAASFAAIGATPDAAAWQRFYAGTERVARALFPTVTEPLATRSETRRLLGDDDEARALWDDLIENPIGARHRARLRRRSGARGRADRRPDRHLRPERRRDARGQPVLPVPRDRRRDGRLGRAGRRHGRRERSALAGSGRCRREARERGRGHGASRPDGEVSYRTGGERGHEHRIAASTVLANVAPYELSRLLGAHGAAVERPEGAQVKVNLLLKRLPRLRDASLDPVAAFGGTFHANEGWRALDDAYRVAAGTKGMAPAIPGLLPVEIYCHSLTDPSILSPELRESGAQTLTVFGLHAPDRLLTEATNDARRAELEAAVFRSLDAVLGEPLADVLLTDGDGRPCVETKTTLDIEHALRMPGGNIFHGPLSWPFAEDDDDLGTPALRWGVATEHERILLCGSGAKRGGAVSALGGHNAAMAVLEAGH